MISGFRKYLGTWGARVLFGLLLVAFVLWGVGDVVRNFGATTWVARVGDRTIEPAEMDQAFRRNMATAQRRTGQEVTPELKNAVATQTLEQLLNQAAVAQEARRLRVVVPQDALRQAIYEIPAFKGANGQFDRATYQNVLSSNGLNEARLLDMLRADLAQQQILVPVAASVGVPDRFARMLYQSQHEKRAADIVEIPFSAIPAPPAATPEQLHRWYDNHPYLYSAPEYRRVKAVLLTPESVGQDIKVTDEELHAAYDQRRSDFQVEARRTAQVIATDDLAKAEKLAEAWKQGANWAAMQDAARKDGGTPVELPDATAQEFPSAELAQAVFAATPNEVVGPVKTGAGFDVVRVTAATEGVSRSFDQAKDELRERLVQEKAADLMYDHANKIEDALSSGTALTELPDNLGLKAVAGTLDNKGNTPSGAPAPIPGPAELRDAVVEAAFKQHKDEPPHLQEVQTGPEGGRAYFALTVDDITPPAPKPYDAVAAQVAEDEMHGRVRHAAEEQAAAMLASVKSGRTIQGAATSAGKQVLRTPLVARDKPDGIPPALVVPLFVLKKGEPTMVETPESFLVATPAEIEDPDPAADPIGFGLVRDRLAAGLGQEAEAILVTALRNRAHPQVDRTLFNQIVQGN